MVFRMIILAGWHNIGIGSALKDGKANIGSKKTPTNFDRVFRSCHLFIQECYLLMGPFVMKEPVSYGVLIMHGDFSRPYL